MEPSREEIEEWFAKERSEGRITDLKFFPGISHEGSVDRTIRAVYSIARGECETEPFDIAGL